jgi:hypothetical protein
MRTILAGVCALGLGFCTPKAQTQTSLTTRSVAPGVAFSQEITTGNAPLIVNILSVDLKASGVKVRCGQAMDSISLQGPTLGREQLHSLVMRSGAVAAINADFFPFTGDPLGLEIRDGELLSEPLEYRACLGLGPAGAKMDVLVPIGTLSIPGGSILPLDGINRIPQTEETIVLTPSFTATPHLGKDSCVVILNHVNLPVHVSQDIYGSVSSIVHLPPNSPLPSCPSDGVLLVGVGKASKDLNDRCAQGNEIHFRFDLTPNSPAPDRGRFPSRAGALRGRSYTCCWTDIQQAVGGGPWLVRDGKVFIDGEAEGMPRAEFVEKRHPRTAIGVKSDGSLLMVTVDGRQSSSRGVSLIELAQIMLRHGAMNAMNLDGGGSTTMIVGGGVVNAPSDGRERPIADSLLVYGDLFPSPPTDDEITYQANSPTGVTIKAGDPVRLTLLSTTKGPLPSELPILWGTQDGFGFVSQQGIFTSFRIGYGTVMAHIGDKQIPIPMHVLCGHPAALKASLGPVANNPPDRNLLTITVLDRFGNPVDGVRAKFEIHAGQVEEPLITDARGRTSSEIVWDSDPGHRILTISIDGAPPITLRH